MKFPEQYRAKDFHPLYRSETGDGFGWFVIPAHKAPKRRSIKVMAADGQYTGWDHVSVSLDDGSLNIPTWEEMCFIRELFWGDDECVVQFHPAKKDYVNFHPGVLHLWRSVKEPFPMPPKLCV